MSIRHFVSVVTLTLLLAACGGGGGDGVVDTPTPLSNKEDVARELGNLVDFISLGSTAASEKSTRTASAWALGNRQPRKSLPKETIACDGGSADEQTGTVQRDFELFDVSRSVDFSIVTANDCRIDGDSQTDTVTIDGVTEEGSSATGADGVSYEYQVQGQNGNPASLRFDEPATGDFVILSGLGLIETAVSTGRSEARVVVAFDTNDNTGYSAMAQVGDNGDPLVAILAGTSFTVDGPYRYSSTRCTGGTVRVATPSALSFGTNGYPNGGELRLTAGDRTAIVNINFDNSATVQLPDGSTQTLSSSEARDIFDNGSDC